LKIFTDLIFFGLEDRDGECREVVLLMICEHMQ